MYEAVPRSLEILKCVCVFFFFALHIRTDKVIIKVRKKERKKKCILIKGERERINNALENKRVENLFC